MDWQKLLKQVAPWLGAAATGNVPALITMAANELGGVLGKDVKPNMDAIAAAVSGATSEQLIAMKAADNDFALKMQQLGFDNVEHLEAIAAADRDSARKREMTLQDWTPRIIAYLIIIAVVSADSAMLSGFEPKIAPELVGRILGTLDAALMLVLGYYFGSSNSGNRKTELIAQGANK